MNNLKENVAYVLAVTISTLLMFIFISFVWIGHDAKRLCQETKWDYKSTDCVEGLIARLEDEKQSYRARNHAVWALGQFGDSRALEALEKYYTGDMSDKEPLDESISQYELEKAIRLAKGGINITAWAWR